MAKEEILTRLRKIEGQVRGLQRMISEERDCEAILTQLMAARAALDKIALSIAGEHLDSCVSGLLEQTDSRTRIMRTMELFLKLSPTVGQIEASDPTSVELG
jgi:CsoR family transcriptional regulator, copper-sensing transcriptional repressor